MAPPASPIAAAAPVAVALQSLPPTPPSAAVPAATPAMPAAPPAGAGFAVTLDFEGTTHQLRCPGEKTLLEAALDAGVELPHSCMSGSCLTCPGRLLSGAVDQSEGVLDDEQQAKGLILTCVSYPTSDLRFTTIDESELD
ncbi:unnamed protein product [Phaeothamnion confervicola]